MSSLCPRLRILPRPRPTVAVHLSALLYRVALAKVHDKFLKCIPYISAFHFYNHLFSDEEAEAGTGDVDLVGVFGADKFIEDFFLCFFTHTDTRVLDGDEHFLFLHVVVSH